MSWGYWGFLFSGVPCLGRMGPGIGWSLHSEVPCLGNKTKAGVVGVLV